MKASDESVAEKLLYDPVKVEFERLFRHKFGDCHLETTFKGNFTGLLKERISEDIVYMFIKRMKGSEHRFPDITGFMKDPGRYSEQFITIEVKNEKVSLLDIYQAKMYADLFDAKYGFLISTEPISDDLKRLHKVRPKILQRSLVDYIFLVQFDAKTSKIVHESWFPGSPFPYEIIRLPPKSAKAFEVELRKGGSLSVEAGADDSISLELVSNSEWTKLNAGQSYYAERSMNGKNLTIAYKTKRTGTWVVRVNNDNETPLEVCWSLTRSLPI